MAREKGLAQWTYIVEGKQIAPLLKTREQMVAQRKPTREWSDPACRGQDESEQGQAVSRVAPPLASGQQVREERAFAFAAQPRPFALTQRCALSNVAPST